MARLLIVACSRRKKPARGQLPAIERYDGSAFRVLRKFLREQQGPIPRILILSGKYGLIEAGKRIQDYDLRMTPATAEMLRPAVLRRLRNVLKAGPIRSVGLCVGRDYRQAVDGLEHQLPEGVTVDLTIQWAGGFVSQHVLIRPVQRYDQLEHYDRLKARVEEGRSGGLTARQIADQLNEEGFRTPTARRTPFTKNKVNQLLAQLGLSRRLMSADSLGPNEWWIADLAAELKIQTRRLYHWIREGFVHATKRSGSKFWILWADADELARLRQLRDYLKTEHRIPYPAHLTRPKDRRERAPTVVNSLKNGAKKTGKTDGETA